MSFRSIELLSNNKINELQAKIDEIIKDEDAFCAIEQSESFEALGIAQFFNGHYGQAFTSLEKAIENKFESIRTYRSIGIIKVLLAHLYFRFGQYNNCENYLKSALLSFKKVENVSCQTEIAVIHSNMAITLLKLNREFEAVEFASNGISIARKLYTQSTDKNTEDYERAEQLLSDYTFNPKESTLILAGIKFAARRLDEAFGLLSTEFVSNTRKSSILLPSGDINEVDELEFNQQDQQIILLRAMIMYNMSIVKYNDSKRHREDAIIMMEEYVKKLTNVRKQANSNKIDLTYLKYKWDENPHFLDFDSYMYPFIILATMLQSKAEHHFLTVELKNGINIQAGKISAMSIIRDIDNYLKSLESLESNMQIPINLLTRTLHHHHHHHENESNNKESSSKQINKTNLNKLSTIMSIDHQSIDNDEIDPHSQPVTSENLIGTETSILSLQSENNNSNVVNKNIQNLSKQFANERERTKSAESSARYNDAIFDDDIDNSKFELTDISVAKGLFNSIELLLKQIPKQNNENITSNSLVRSSSNFLKAEYKINIDNDLGVIIPNSTIKSAKGSKKQKSSSPKKSAALSLNDVLSNQEHYSSSKHDGSTVRSEILLLMNHFGCDEVYAWIQWALSLINGIGFGFLGFTSYDPHIEHGFNKDYFQSPENKIFPPKSLLLEIKQRLLDIEVLCLPSPSKQTLSEEEQSLNFSSSVLEKRILILILLIKVTSQCNEKIETGLFINQLEVSVMAFKKKIVCEDSLFYVSLFYKLKFEYLEWSYSPLMSNEESLHHLVTVNLPCCKMYYNSTEILSYNLSMKRDSLKKLINLYIQISKIPIDSKDRVNVGISSMELKNEFNRLNDIVVEMHETSDPEWVRKYGKFRALKLMGIMKELSE
eukprot:gene6608-9075_t